MHGKPITDATEILNRLIRTGDKVWVEVSAISNENLQKFSVVLIGTPNQYMDISKDDVRAIIPKLPDLKPGDRVKCPVETSDTHLESFIVAIDYDDGTAWVRHKSRPCGVPYSYNSLVRLDDLERV